MNRALLGTMLRRYGQSVTVTDCDGGQTDTRAFVQPILERGETDLQVHPTPLGTRRGDRYLYLGAAEVPLRAGDRVEGLGLTFWVQTAQPIRVGDELSHWWAILRVKGEKEP